jgi:hypothetical protein
MVRESMDSRFKSWLDRLSRRDRFARLLELEKNDEAILKEGPFADFLGKRWMKVSDLSFHNSGTYIMN